MDLDLQQITQISTITVGMGTGLWTLIQYLRAKRKDAAEAISAALADEHRVTRLEVVVEGHTSMLAHHGQRLSELEGAQ